MSVLKTAKSVSPMFVITAESFQHRVHPGVSTQYKGMVNPPVISSTGIIDDKAINIQCYPTWNFEKIVEIRQDKNGILLNNPDFISEHHMIGIMRGVDAILAPSYKAYVSVRTSTPSAVAPNKK